MDADEFRVRGKEMIDYVADYLENVRSRRTLPEVKPGYLKKLVPDEAPENPEEWNDIFPDIERVIMPGVTHWQSPQFHAYYPASNSYPALLGELLCSGINTVGFSWIASPAVTELEVLVMDWLAKMLHLPQEFMSGGQGGGILYGSASEGTFMALLAARCRKLKTHVTSSQSESGLLSRLLCNFSMKHKIVSKKIDLSKLVCYCSDQAHFSVERAAMLAAVQCHKVAADTQGRMRGESLRAAIEGDRAKGLIPFYCVAALGTTSCCSFDNLQEIGPVCQEADVWLHIDAAYAGAAFICPQFRPLLNGVEMADSFGINPHKWLLTNMDCSAMWYKDISALVEASDPNPLIVKHEPKEQHQNENVPDYRLWQIPMSRRFRSLRLWFVLRSYGVKGLQQHIARHIELAHEFESHVRKDERFEITHKVIMGLVCFRLRQRNEINEELLQRINADGRIHITPSKARGVYFLRFVVCSSSIESKDVTFAWKTITELACNLLKETGLEKLC